MGSFVGGGGLEQPQMPDIPVANYTQQAEAQVTGQRKAGFFGALLGPLGPAISSAWQYFLMWLAASFDQLMTWWVKFMTSMQGMNNPLFFDLASSFVSDLLGIEISAENVQRAWERGGVVPAQERLGEEFINQLLGEFAGGEGLTPESGLKAASTFIGFLISFTVREANIEFMTSLIPESYRFGEGMRGYAQDIARNVGLGRLARRVLGAPVQFLITTPLTWYYNAKYRPTLFPVGELFRTFTRGFIDETTLDEQMAYHGIPAKWKDAMVKEYQRVPYQTEFFRAYQFGDLSSQQIIDAYKSLGYSPEVAQLLFDYTRYNDANSEVNGMLSDLENMRLNAFIDEPTFRTLVDSLPVAPDRKRFYLNKVGQQLEFPRKGLTLSEVQQAFIQGILDIGDLETFLQDEGYSQDDRYTLELLTLAKLTTAEAKYNYLKISYEQKKARAIAKGLPIPPEPAGLAVPPA